MLDASFGGVHPWGVGLSVDEVALGLLALLGKNPQALLLGVVNADFWWYSIPLKHKGQRLVSV